MPRSGTTLEISERVLILAKTYPTPSRGYVETSCVAGIADDGSLRRIFPVPFRLLPDDQKFRKWQWVTAKLRPPTDDRRPESRRINADSINIGETLETGRDRKWTERMRWIEPHVMPSYKALEQRREATGETLGFLRPRRLIGLEITLLPPAERDWTEAQRAKLTRDMQQGDLFADGAGNEEPLRSRQPLEKLPYHFHYRYEIDTAEGPEEKRHLITDWEAGTLYRNCRARHGEDWEEPFRQRLEIWMRERDLLLMMGTQHQYPDQWLVISLIYPPATMRQPTLEL